MRFMDTIAKSIRGYVLIRLGCQRLSTVSPGIADARSFLRFIFSQFSKHGCCIVEIGGMAGVPYKIECSRFGG